MFCWLRWRFTVVTFFIDSNLVYYDVIYPYMNISAIFWSVVIGGYDLITHLFVSLISVRHQKDSFIVLLISLFSEAFHHHYNKKKPCYTKHSFCWYCNIHVSKYCLSNYYLGVISYMTSLCIAVAWSAPQVFQWSCPLHFRMYIIYICIMFHDKIDVLCRLWLWKNLIFTVKYNK